MTKTEKRKPAMVEKLKLGIIGCGNISGTYFTNLTTLFPWLTIEGCSELIEERSKAKAEAFNVPKCYTTEELLADDTIDIAVNLTTPVDHAAINQAALAAGKHVYCEKPLAIDRQDAVDTVKMAEDKGLLVGCAPDTFLGGGIQTCRKIIDDGIIGDIVSAMAFMVNHGHESWHPDPEFYYEQGGGPMLDMGPYYVTALINCIGPATRVMGSTGAAFQERTITSEKKYGKKVAIETPTHLTGTIDFENGAIATIVTSFDVWASRLPRIEIHGTKGSLMVPDPNTFDGPVKLFREGDKEWLDIPVYTHGYVGNSRGLGLADMALAIMGNRQHRVSGQLAAHALDVMLAFEESSETGRAVKLSTTCNQPAALPTGLKQGEIW